MFYQTSQVSLPTPASGTRNPEGGYPPDKKKFSVTSRMDPVFISVVSGNLRPIENAGSGGSQEGRNLHMFWRNPPGFRPPRTISTCSGLQVIFKN